MIPAAILSLLPAGLAGIADKGLELLLRYIPDPAAQEKARAEFINILVQSDIAQLKVNEAEAQTGNMFLAGWRPFIGWVCGVVVACYYLPFCLATTGIWIYACFKAGAVVGRPSMDMTDVMGLLGGMLGMGALRSFDKFHGTDTKAIQRVGRDADNLSDAIKEGR